ncbi:MAG: RnfABCDGE type electron transport complex subunit D [Crocinitomicaceae bacterium]
MTAIEFTLQSPLKRVITLIKSFTADARHFQIIYLLSFLIYGLIELKWEIGYDQIFVVMGAALSTQFLWLKITGGKMSGLKSAMITGLGLCLLLKSASLMTLGIAATLAISSKFVLKIKNKHLFNPANFGIIISIIVLQDAWISPGQWGSSALFLFVLSVFGGIVLLKIGRLETSLVFIGSLFVMEYIRTVLYQGWEMDVLFHKFSSGTLLLFTFFMITDPMTIPNSKKARMIWALVLATATFILSNWMQIYTAPIWVLFFMTPLTVFLDKIYPQLKFEWNQPTSTKHIVN